MYNIELMYGHSFRRQHKKQTGLIQCPLLPSSLGWHCFLGFPVAHRFLSSPIIHSAIPTRSPSCVPGKYRIIVLLSRLECIFVSQSCCHTSDVIDRLTGALERKFHRLGMLFVGSDMSTAPQFPDHLIRPPKLAIYQDYTSVTRSIRQSSTFKSMRKCI